MSRVRTTTKVAPAAWTFLVVDLLLLGMLVWLAYLRHIRWGFIGDLNDPMADLMPLIVPWGGALGGLCASMFGVAMHSRDWDNGYNPWHLLRVPIGALTGAASFLIVVVILRTAGVEAEKTDAVAAASAAAISVTPGALGLYMIISFAVGFQNKYFLELIKKVAQVILSNGDPKEKNLSVTATPDVIDFGHVLIGHPLTESVSVDVVGATDLRLDASWFSDPGKPFTVVATASEDVLGLSHKDLKVTCDPVDAGEFDSTLTITIGTVSRSVRLKAMVP